MKNFFSVPFVFFLLPCTLAFAQVEVYGYFEPQYSGLYLDSVYYQSNYGKLRIDLHSTDVKNVRFGADVIYLTYFGKRNWNILEFLPDHVTDSIPPDMQPYYQFAFSDTFYLDNVYARLSMKRCAISVGKQQISFGTGYFSNPTDVFNKKDAVDPTYEQSGHNALRLDVYPAARVSLTILYTPLLEKWEDSGKLGRLKIGLGHFDVSAIGYQFYDTLTDFYTFQQFTQERILFGGDIVGELFGLGVWGEGIYNVMENEDDSYEFLAGFDYTFEGGFYSMVEYHHNSLGRSDYREYDLNDWMRYVTGETKTLCQDQLYGLIQFPLADLVTLGSMAIFSINDQSAVIIPMITCSLFENVDITSMINLYTGGEGKTHSNAFGYGGFIRATVYF